MHIKTGRSVQSPLSVFCSFPHCLFTLPSLCMGQGSLWSLFEVIPCLRVHLPRTPFLFTSGASITLHTDLLLIPERFSPAKLHQFSGIACASLQLNQLAPFGELQNQVPGGGTAEIVGPCFHMEPTHSHDKKKVKLTSCHLPSQTDPRVHVSLLCVQSICTESGGQSAQSEDVGTALWPGMKILHFTESLSTRYLLSPVCRDILGRVAKAGGRVCMLRIEWVSQS